MIWIKHEVNNPIVTDFYINTIGYVFKNMGFKVTDCDVIEKEKLCNDDIVVCSTAVDVYKLKQRKKVKIVYWVQGVWPEESYMRNRSIIRLYIASIIEKNALKRADFLFFVSYAMKDHYEKKYSLHFKNFHVMPCMNDQLHLASFAEPEKYDNNIFCYVGSTAVWQCFEQTIRLYSKIEKFCPNCKLLILVKNKELAMEYVNKYNVRNFEIDFVTGDELQSKLRNVKFGFLLREENIVNEVATPTKTLTYIANGIIPIYSRCLEGIYNILKESDYTVILDRNDDWTAIQDSIQEKIYSNDIFLDYYKIYMRYYNRDEHQTIIESKFKKIFKSK